ncbi:hypothetical protein PENTCL1PPCAC_13631, partial [Pristionchus entomophagus]
TTLRRFYSHLKKHHNSTLKEKRIFLRCSCGCRSLHSTSDRAQSQQRLRFLSVHSPQTTKRLLNVFCARHFPLHYVDIMTNSSHITNLL